MSYIDCANQSIQLFSVSLELFTQFGLVLFLWFYSQLLEEVLRVFLWHCSFGFSFCGKINRLEIVSTRVVENRIKKEAPSQIEWTNQTNSIKIIKTIVENCDFQHQIKWIPSMRRRPVLEFKSSTLFWWFKTPRRRFMIRSRAKSSINPLD